MAFVDLVQGEEIEYDEEGYAVGPPGISKQVLRDLSNPFTINDRLFLKLYRMPKNVAIILIDRLSPLLHESDKSIPIFQQVLSVVRFIAVGSYQHAISEENLHPMSQSSFSIYLHKVVRALNALDEQFIVFPRNDVERRVIQEGFQARLRFPGVLGAVDGTLIHIVAPKRNEEAYVDHRHNHSLNVQVIADTNYNIMNIRIVSGCTHDSFAWKHSSIREHMNALRNNQDIVEEEGKFFIIGDDGYTPSPVLLTAVRGAAPNTPEYRFSQALRSARCVVEQTIGVWKQICRCINNERVLHYEADFAAKIVNAAGVFYNFLRHHGLPMPVQQQYEGHEVYEPEVNNEYRAGLRERQHIIDNYFKKKLSHKNLVLFLLLLIHFYL